MLNTAQYRGESTPLLFTVNIHTNLRRTEATEREETIEEEQTFIAQLVTDTCMDKQDICHKF